MNEQKTLFKIDNLLSCIIGSNEYKSIRDLEKYDNYIQPQKEVLKTHLIPKVKSILSDLIENERNYSKIKIEKVTTKYTKAEKFITIELFYDDNRENIHIISNIFEDLKYKFQNELYKYPLLLRQYSV